MINKTVDASTTIEVLNGEVVVDSEAYNAIDSDGLLEVYEHSDDCVNYVDSTKFHDAVNALINA